MNSHTQKIEPQKVTKPIQLLAAWLVGLILIDGIFLTAASALRGGGLESSILVIAAVLNVPIFLIALFVLQTRFRPELQEDSYYSQYLDKKTNRVIKVQKEDVLENEVATLFEQIRGIKRETAREDERAFPICIGLNQGFPDFDNLRNFLKEKSIPLHDIFGSSDDKDKPARLVAIDEALDFSAKKKVLKLACDMDMESYLYFNPREEYIAEEVLIGAFGDPKYPISEKLKALLNTDFEAVDLKIYERENKIGSQSASSNL